MSSSRDETDLSEWFMSGLFPQHINGEESCHALSKTRRVSIRKFIFSGMPLPGAPDVPMDRQMKEGDDFRKYLSQSTKNLRLFSVYLFPRKSSEWVWRFLLAGDLQKRSSTHIGREHIQLG